MDWGALASTALGGFLAIAGGYIAVVVGENSRRKADKAERRRVIERAVLNDTRDYMLAQLDEYMAIAMHDEKSRAASNWPAAARTRRIDLGYICDADVYAQFRDITNRLITVQFDERIEGLTPRRLTPQELVAAVEMRGRLTAAFIGVEQGIEGDGIQPLDAETIRRIDQEHPLHTALLAEPD